MLEEPVEDKDDVFIENLYTAMFLLLGILSVFGSVVMLGYSAIVAVYNQQFMMSLGTTSIFAAFLSIMGVGSLHLFRKRRRLRKEKTSSLFYRQR